MPHTTPIFQQMPARSTLLPVGCKKNLLVHNARVSVHETRSLRFGYAPEQVRVVDEGGKFGKREDGQIEQDEAHAVRASPAARGEAERVGGVRGEFEPQGGGALPEDAPAQRGKFFVDGGSMAACRSMRPRQAAGRTYARRSRGYRRLPTSTACRKTASRT